MNDAVELVDVFRTWAHVVDAGVVHIGFDNMAHTIEAEPAALDLLLTPSLYMLRWPARSEGKAHEL